MHFYFNTLDSSSCCCCGEFIQALDDKFRLLSSLPFALPEEFKNLCQLLSNSKVIKLKQPIINEIHSVLNNSQVWDDSVLVSLKDEPLKNSIIDLKNEIETKYKEKYEYNNVGRLGEYYAESLKSLKPEIEAQIHQGDDFGKISEGFMRFLLFRYLLKTEKSLSELCSNFPHLKGPVNILDKLLGSGVFLILFRENVQNSARFSPNL